MNVKNIWTIVKNRYRLSTKYQMYFEFSFPEYLIGKCRFTTDNAYQIRTQKISPSLKGVILSDTIPLSWFTSSALIPWSNVVEITTSDKSPAVDDFQDTPLSSRLQKQTVDYEYFALRIDDPQEMTIDLPWSKEFTNYVQKNKLFKI